ncbi:S41 family peptidase [Shewanella maritima]|uniref:S41 family peptidase n=1 Tax=Shewanella maritima TaxID=2520507 RepID=A0A411PHS2_9GAMM|nr:S41 family peptidase [Shewanella maritima]QBF83095.1 S41 family peptidase [Shewanella maritima]
MHQSLRYLACFICGVLVAMSVSLSSSEHTFIRAESSGQEYDLALLYDVIDTVETYYLNQVERPELIKAAIDGVFKHLDPYSGFLNRQAFQSLTDSNKGEYFGFGFEVATEGGKITVITPFAGSPAANAGIMPGDVISHFNEVEVTESNLNMVLTGIKQHSQQNQAINLTVVSDALDEQRELIISPSHVHIESIQARVINNIGYINIANFQSDAAKAIIKQSIAWQELQLDGVILDVRNNPGGLLDQAIEIADLFLDKGRIVSTQGRFFDANEDYYASKHTIFNQLPVAVLINKGSASASEVLAAALQENDRAVLLGEKSFGKGTVQSLIPMLSQGNAIKLTIAKYNTPKGNDIHSVGIAPDIKVDFNTVSTNTNVPIITAYNLDDPLKDLHISSAINWISQNNN